MSDLNSFLEKAKGDDGLKQKLSEVGSPAEIVAVGSEAGYNFSEADVEQASKESLSSGEIKQEDLDKVSGGSPISIVVMTILTCFR